MIHKLVLKNFKKIKEETFEFNNFDIIVGSNNSGKSTVLQALAIWQYCVDMFLLSKKTGNSRAIQVVLPSFTVLPLPEFNLLWNDQITIDKPSKTNEPVHIEIDVYWKNSKGIEENLNVKLRYASPQSVYAHPDGWWNKFKKYDPKELPHIVYVPPFSGLETHEAWLDDGNVRQNVGKAHPGSVLRNLLYRVIDQGEVSPESNKKWKEINDVISKWFDVELLLPKYTKGISTEIKSEYRSNSNGKVFDIISGGSGFHQILTLLSFLYGYSNVTTICFDEPDAHLHVNLQRQIVNYFEQKSQETNVQFIIASHSEEFIKGVNVDSIISMMSGTPNRVSNSENIIRALSDVNNIDIVRTQDSPYILYVEGEDDDRILSTWADTLNKGELYHRFYPYVLGGTDKKNMTDKSQKHYLALKEINPDLKRIMILDFDTVDSYHPPDDNFVCNEWKRKNIDSYFLIPDVWKRIISKNAGLFTQMRHDLVDNFFQSQNLTLPPKTTWKDVSADIFSLVDGKKLLFENKDSLFQQIKNECGINVTRETLASAMTYDEIHKDIEHFFLNMDRVFNSE